MEDTIVSACHAVFCCCILTPLVQPHTADDPVSISTRYKKLVCVLFAETTSPLAPLLALAPIVKDNPSPLVPLAVAHHENPPPARRL